MTLQQHEITATPQEKAINVIRDAIANGYPILTGAAQIAALESLED